MKICEFQKNLRGQKGGTKFIISIDQSTQGTKALLFDGCGKLLAREDQAHRQLVNAQGWVSHDLREIADNTVRAVGLLMEKNGVSPAQIVAVGISNQRETTAMWDRGSGEPLADAPSSGSAAGRGVLSGILQSGDLIV